MGYIVSNIGAILAATGVGLVFGFLLFRATHRGPAARFEPLQAVLVVLAEFWLASILAGALILAPATEAGPWTMAIGSAVVIWIGFVLPTLVVSGLARQDGAAAILGHCGHWLAVMVLQAVVLKAIGLVHP